MKFFKKLMSWLAVVLVIVLVVVAVVLVCVCPYLAAVYPAFASALMTAVQVSAGCLLENMAALAGIMLAYAQCILLAMSFTLGLSGSPDMLSSGAEAPSTEREGTANRLSSQYIDPGTLLPRKSVSDGSVDEVEFVMDGDVSLQASTVDGFITMAEVAAAAKLDLLLSQGQVNRLDAALEAAIQEGDAKVATLQDLLREQAQAYEAAEVQAALALAAANEALAQAQAQAGVSEETIAALAAEIQVKQSALEDVQNEAARARVSLQDQIVAAQNANGELQKQKEAVQALLAQREAENLDLLAETRRLETVVGDSQTRIDDLVGQLSDSQHVSEDLKAQLDGLLDRLADAEASITLMTANDEAARARINQLLSDISELRAQAARATSELESQIEELKGQLTSMVPGEEAAALQADIERLQEALQIARNAGELTADDLQAAHARVGALSNIANALVAATGDAELEAALASYQQTLASPNSEVSEAALLTAIKKTASRIQELESAGQLSEEARLLALDAAKEAVQRADALEAALAATNSSNAVLRERCAALEQLVAAIESPVATPSRKTGVSATRAALVGAIAAVTLFTSDNQSNQEVLP